MRAAQTALVALSTAIVSPAASAQERAKPAAPWRGAASSAALSRGADSPAALWRGVDSIGVTCLIHTPRGVDDGALTARLCAAVRARAAAGAPVPVVLAASGGAALAPGRVTLLVQGGVSDVRGAPVLALSLRAFRNGAEAAQWWAAAPRAVARDDAAALDAAVGALLADTLPWRARALGGALGGPLGGARRIPD